MSAATAERVADRTLDVPVTVWGFGVGGALSAMVRAGRRLDRDDWVEGVAALIVPSLDARPDPTDHLISVKALQALAAARPDTKIDDTCERWATAVLDAHRPMPGGPRVHRPDLPAWASTIWVDCMHTDGPGLAALGMYDDAVACAREYAAVLQRDDGLFHHGYDASAGRGNGVAWGRGQAWALLGLVETLRLVDDAVLRHRLARLVDAIAAHEDRVGRDGGEGRVGRDGGNGTGRWRAIVDDPESPVENSVAAYVAQGVARAVRYGLVDAAHASMADRAYAATVRLLDDGGLRVSEATPVGDTENYRSRALGVFPWGQAPVLHAMLDRLDGEGAS
jgi:rhamnogalacturonyl hydrolase YesR